MIPLYLEFQAFGPYPCKESIDFSAFGAHSLFLIRGETGAGKTVILDAITYALYGRSSGAGRGDLTAMRCQQASDSDTTYTTFTFQAGSKEYRFTRSLYRRKKRNGTVEYEPRQDAFAKNAAGEWTPIFPNPRRSDVDNEAARLTGLQYEQFRQVVILPQGQFERLLVANSEEKEEILSSLFGTSHWGEATERVAEQARALQKQAEQQGILCRSLLESRDCESLDALCALREQTEIAFRKNELLLASLREEQKTLQAELSAGAALERDFERLDEARSGLARARDRASEIEVKRSLLKLKDFAALYYEWDATEQEAIARRQQVRDQNQLISECDAQIKSYEEMVAFQDARIAELERSASMEAALTQLCALHKQYEKGANEIIETMGMIQRLNFEADELHNTYLESQEVYQKAVKSYWKQVESTLAADLSPGKPCPVCGSREHPKPAKPPKGAAITAAQLDTFSAAAEKARDDLNRRNSEIDYLQIALDRQQAALREQGNYSAEEITRAEKNLEKARDDKAKMKNLLEKRSNSNAHLTSLHAKRSSLLEKREELSLISERYQENERLLRARVLELDPDSVLVNRLRDCNLTPEAYAKIEEEIKSFDAELDALNALEQALTRQLENQQRPMLKEMQAKLLATENALQMQEREDALSRKKLEELDALQSRYEVEHAKYEEQSASAEKQTRFARLLRGSNGVGLQRYVLGAMLSAVTEEANRLLENVHSGRYQIYRTDTSSGLTRKAGLELEVFDRWSGERRGVASLSGGEKFLVALSLSIGLSSAVQARSAASRLGAVFIDEGFGTLDRSSMQDALHVLSSIGVSSGMVGIISHVQALQESIPSGIVVKKDAHGSTLRVLYD